MPGVVGTETHIAFRAYSRHDLESAFSLGLTSHARQRMTFAVAGLVLVTVVYPGICPVTTTEIFLPRAVRGITNVCFAPLCPVTRFDPILQR